jgi:hypothetical protein
MQDNWIQQQKERRQEEMCVVLNFAGLNYRALATKTPTRNLCPLAKGWGRVKAFNYLNNPANAAVVH